MEKMSSSLFVLAEYFSIMSNILKLFSGRLFTYSIFEVDFKILSIFLATRRFIINVLSESSTHHTLDECCTGGE